RLRREKQRLLLENQAIAARLEAADLEAAQMDVARATEFERRERALQIENERLRQMLLTAQDAEGRLTLGARSAVVQSRPALPAPAPAAMPERQAPGGAPAVAAVSLA